MNFRRNPVTGELQQSRRDVIQSRRGRIVDAHRRIDPVLWLEAGELRWQRAFLRQPSPQAGHPPAPDRSGAGTEAAFDLELCFQGVEAILQRTQLR